MAMSVIVAPPTAVSGRDLARRGAPRIRTTLAEARRGLPSTRPTLKVGGGGFEFSAAPGFPVSGCSHFHEIHSDVFVLIQAVVELEDHDPEINHYGH